MPEPTFQNLGFELAGPAPGLAAGWTFAFHAGAEEIAGYGPAPERPAEDFARFWSGNEAFMFAFEPDDVEPALYDESPESVEDFEEEWSQNESFLRELASAEAADYDPGPGTKLVEDFDGLWAGNESFIVAFAPGDLAAAPLEAFESGWRSNEAFLFAFAPADLSSASYDAAGVAEPVEDFEELFPMLVMTTV
jgi:hypothetical protein